MTTSKTNDRASGQAPANGNGSGRNKSRAKKREYKEHCRQMRRAGYYTTEHGVWYEAKGEDRVRFQDGLQK